MKRKGRRKRKKRGRTKRERKREREKKASTVFGAFIADDEFSRSPCSC